MKVLNFICMLAVGGTERQFVYATKALHEAGLDMYTGVMKRKGPFVKDIEALGIPLDEYRTHSLHSIQTLRQQWALSQDISAKNIEVVHAYGFYANVFAIPAARLARRRPLSWLACRYRRVFDTVTRHLQKPHAVLPIV